jgi:hypothetical protein
MEPMPAPSDRAELLYPCMDLEQYPLTLNRGAIRKRMKLLANRWLAHDLQKQIMG